MLNVREPDRATKMEERLRALEEKVQQLELRLWQAECDRVREHLCANQVDRDQNRWELSTDIGVP